MFKQVYLLLFVFVVSCSNNPQKLTLANDEFPTLEFSDELNHKVKSTKITTQHKSNELSLKVKSKNLCFKIKVLKNGNLFSKKQFRLFPVKDSLEFKQYANHDLFQKIIDRESLLGLKSKFVNVKAGGNTDCFFFQEALEKTLIESSESREGILFTYTTELSVKHQPKKTGNSSKTLKERIDQWKKGLLNTSCLFDVEKTGKYLALYEGFNMQNTKLAYYLNPVSNLIEPLSYVSKKKHDQLYKQLLGDSLIKAEIQFIQNEYRQNRTIHSTLSKHKLFVFLTALNWNSKDAVTSTILNKNPCLNNTYKQYLNEHEGVFTLKSDFCTLKEPLLIPKGGKFVLNKGQKIDLINGAFIISYSPLELAGSDAKPVSISSSDSTGKGLHVIQAKTNSTLKHVVFNQLNSLNHHDWTLPSAVTFYESPVNITHCKFMHSQAEDAINVFRSTFTFENSTISNSFSDAFDADFSSGVIKKCRFINSGNDGVDVSGSNIQVTESEFVNIEDKAISAGEKSTVMSENLIIRTCSQAFTAKDLSTVSVLNSTVKESEVVYLAFQKKHIYGGGKIISQGVSCENFKEISLIEKGSSLVLEGKKQHNYTDNVMKYLYGKEYGKKQGGDFQKTNVKKF